MPVGPVDEHGAELYYEDTGALAGNYLTVVLVHAVGFHSGIFRRTLPSAAKHGLRIVLVNRRDYPGSTPLSQEDLDAINSNDDERRAEFYRKQAFQFAEFLAWFVQAEKIPPFTISSDGKKQGGIALLGWSFGNTLLMDILAFPERIPERTHQILEPYFRTLCSFDAPHHVYGLEDPETPKFYHPFNDADLGRLETYGAFVTWVSSYYPHPDPTSGDPATLTEEPLPEPEASLILMTPEEMMGVTYPKAQFRWETDRVLRPFATQWARTERVLDKSTAGYWPRCKFTVVSCQQALWEPVYGAWRVDQLHDEKVKNGTAGKSLELVRFEGANHFVFWDEPERFCELLAARL